MRRSGDSGRPCSRRSAFRSSTIAEPEIEARHGFAGARRASGGRGAPRLRRGATSVGGFGGPFRGPPFSVEVIEVLYRGLDRERLKRKALLEAVNTRLTLESVQKLTRHVLLDRPVSVQKLSPQGHMLKSMGGHVSAGRVRDRKQATIRFEVVQPRRPDHP